MRGYQKYKAKPTVVDGIRFASMGEAARYKTLAMMQRAGRISGLVLQPKFVLKVAGLKIATYVADFRYIEAGQEVVEDFKGVHTPVFRLKAKLFCALYPRYLFRITGKCDL